MNIKVRKVHPDAVLPKSAKTGDAGYDLVAVADPRFSDTYIEYDTGIAVEPPDGYHIEIFPRSSISKYDLVLANSIGLVDNGYRGNLLVRFKVVPQKNWLTEYGIFCEPTIYKKGDKIAQIVIRKTESAEFEWAEELSNTDRDSGGFGSTG